MKVSLPLDTIYLIVFHCIEQFFYQVFSWHTNSTLLTLQLKIAFLKFAITMHKSLVIVAYLHSANVM